MHLVASPGSRACLSAGTLASALVTTLVLLAASYTSLGPWANPPSAFASHPALMALAFTLALPLSLVAYAVELPSGQAARAKLGPGDRHWRRRAHGLLSAAAALACLAGWAVAYSVREAHGKSHLPWGKRWDKQVHIWGGYVLCGAVTLQSVLGALKYASRVATNTRVVAWHGSVGPAIAMLGVVCVATGANFSFLGKGHAFAGVAVLGGLALLVACVLLLLYALPRPFLVDSNAERFVASSGEGGPPTAGGTAAALDAHSESEHAGLMGLENARR